MKRTGKKQGMKHWILIVSVTLLGATLGCRSKPEQKKNQEFFTSGSREADQRASQRMAKAEQLSGTGEGAGEKDVKKAKPEGESKKGDETTAAQATKKLALYERLGGEQGINNIVNDFVARALQDPRVNWQRNGVKQGGFSFHRNKTVTWDENPDSVAALKKHLAQFLSLASGGPARYEGEEIPTTNAGMRIPNPEFDAAVGDLKATLDKLQIPNTEQKELLAIVESTRPQIVTVR